MVSEGRDFYEKKIETSLSLMATKLKCENSCGKAAYNKTAEAVMCGLLNKMYGYQFQNTNTEGRPNFPGIDLISSNRWTGVQITTQNTLKKVDKTLKTVRENEECSSIKHLIILILTFDSPTQTMKERKADRWFNGAEDIWTLRTIMNILQDSETSSEKLQEIAAYLAMEIGGGVVDPEPAAIDGEIESLVREPVSSLDTQVQKENVIHGIPRRFVILTAILLCVMIAIWSICSNTPKYVVSSPESRDLIQWRSIEDILCDGNLEKTAIPLSVYNPSLNDGGHWNSNKIHSASYPFTVQCSQIPVNPIAAFFAIRKDYFEQVTTSFDINIEDVAMETEYYDRWCEYFYRMPDGPVKEWEWSEAGVNAFLSDMLVLASKFDDGFDLDDRFLSVIHSGEETAVHFSPEEQCYYVYFIYYGDCTSHVVSMYFRADQESGTRIDDVEFQFLNMDYTIKGGMGFSLAERVMTNTNREQMLSMIVSAEHLLTGSSGLEESIREWNVITSEFVVPAEYQVEDYRVTIQHNGYFATTRYDEELAAESCELLTYSIHRSVS